MVKKAYFAILLCTILLIYIYYNSRRQIPIETTHQAKKGFDPQKYIEGDIAAADFKRYQFNRAVSDRIPWDRTLPDTRLPGCEKINYRIESLPSTTVIITFHNEARSTLLRTIKSVLSRSSGQLIEEIILVDDFSDNETDGLSLASLSKVKLIRNEERRGLVQSRNIGARSSAASTLTFLDSHCEVNSHWLEPLLARVAENHEAIVSPVIDIIDKDNFQYYATNAKLKGGFDWNMEFKWDNLNEKEMQQFERDPTSPIRTAVMAGGLFTITKYRFFKLQGYDPYLEIWGGENFEMSFKNWMCGGSLEILPCSRVGHVFRREHPYSFPRGNIQTYVDNIKRVAEVWMDGYAKFFHSARGLPLELPPGLLAQKQLRNNLGCRNFKWYLQNVYADLRVPSENDSAQGNIEKPETKVCLVANGNKVVSDTCSSKQIQFQETSPHSGNGLNQDDGQYVVTSSNEIPPAMRRQWVMKTDGSIVSSDGRCLGVNHARNVQLQDCSESKANQQWRIMIRDRLRHHVLGSCIEARNNKVFVSTCKENYVQQKWKFPTRFY